MVAYSFKKYFAPEIRAGVKTGTIRGPRRRHAQPGEIVQLYTGMRTKHCAPILEPHPVCTRVRQIRIEFTRPCAIKRIELDGIPVKDLDAFAVADGFEWVRHKSPIKQGRRWTWVTPREHGPLAVMGAFWGWEHGCRAPFQGVHIEWESPT